jgi:hypothetical protein
MAILDFFYAGDDCLANLYKEDFECSVPDHVIALVITCVSLLSHGIDFSLIICSRLKIVWRSMSTMTITKQSRWKEINIGQS